MPLSPMQREVAVGSLLGDGHLAKTTRGYALRFHHSIGQETYIVWKYTLLRDFVRTGPRHCGRATYFRTVSHPSFESLRAQFYKDAKKVVPIALLEAELGSIALAIWFMDDGSLDGRQIRINTQSFTIAEVEELAALLERRFSIEAALNLDKGRPRLRICARSTSSFVELIRPYVVDSMLYKLP
jgi:hypothetical protein